VHSAVGRGSEFAVTIPVAACPAGLLPSPSIVSLTLPTAADLSSAAGPRTSHAQRPAEGRRARPPSSSQLLHVQADSRSAERVPRDRRSRSASGMELARVDITRHAHASSPMPPLPLATLATPSTGEHMPTMTDSAGASAVPWQLMIMCAWR
jgi:hypothetical protein